MRFSYSQIFTASVAALFIVVVFTHFGTDDGLNGISNGISESLMRGNIKTIMAKSESLWEKTVRQRHEVLAQKGDMGLFPADGGPNYFTYPYSVWDLVPASYNCPFEVERIGRMGDGGKWVCGMSRYEKSKTPCIIYSFGVQNESSYEQEMLERTNCRVWGYDFSVSEFGPALVEPYRSRTQFLQAGIAGKTDLNADPPFYSIQDLMAMNGHDYIDILKIDIEYYEFEALNSLLQHTLFHSSPPTHPLPSTSTPESPNNPLPNLPIGQMLIELHLFQSQGVSLPTFLEWWESLEARGMRPAWTEPNLLAVTLGLEDKNPRLAEYTLINVQNKKNKLFY